MADKKNMENKEEIEKELNIYVEALEKRIDDVEKSTTESPNLIITWWKYEGWRRKFKVNCESRQTYQCYW